MPAKQQPEELQDFLKETDGKEMTHQEPCETLTLERPPRPSDYLSNMVESEPMNFLSNTGCNAKVEEADVQAADVLKPAIEFTWPSTQTTNEMSVCLLNRKPDWVHRPPQR